MSNTLLQLSPKPALRLHARVVADVQKVASPLGVRLMMTGAFARDLHLHHAWGVPVRRETHDVDFALAVPDWPAFQTLRAALLASGQFIEASGVLHRLRHSQGLPIDLVPFGAIETAQRQIVWPPAGDVVMDVFGFQEAWATAVNVALPDDVQAVVVSLPALAWLKMVCWQDRHRRSPGKDAQDLQLILNHYLDAGNEPRLWEEFVAWTLQDGFDYTLTAARMLGRDMRHQLNAEARARIAAIVARQTDADRPDLLPNEMNPRNPQQAVAQLRSLLQGLNTED
ncbi:nucleotidyl transferase AbiEii/AbiGii toxin family protein [Hylemonella sp. W303a]|uniref:nucleotidyl transferase AbiEii/AbiGii toxin family protein n=1 Tax=Hylemonella sp. W303a TaxID=3389873 RepID=UPI00396AFC6A